MLQQRMFIAGNMFLEVFVFPVTRTTNISFAAKGSKPLLKCRKGLKAVEVKAFEDVVRNA